MKPMSKAEIVYLSLTLKKAQMGDKEAQSTIEMLDKVNKTWGRPTVKEQLEIAKQEYQKKNAQE